MHHAQTPVPGGKTPSKRPDLEGFRGLVMKNLILWKCPYGATGGTVSLGRPNVNKTGFKTDEERGGWWGALKKRFYRDMG